MMPVDTVTIALQRLKKHGYKYTQKREDIITVFVEENRYLPAKAVLQALEDEYPTLSYDTIYRNLYTFVEVGILEETELNNEKLFRITCPHEGHHHHHFICQQCGMTIALQMCPMDFFEQQLEGCQISSHRFEIFGVCKNCLTAG